jgi:excisionase family DNA binding protein
MMGPGMTSRIEPTSDRDTETAAFGHVRGGRRSGSGLPKYHTIKAVAEALDVSPRTVRRWIANRDLIVHRVDGVVRIAESDLRAFLALHREG